MRVRGLDRGRQQAVVSKVMNFQLQQNAENVLTNLETSSFSKKGFVLCR